jgi:branched-chain amino acid transport system substrate-binding protein
MTYKDKYFGFAGDYAEDFQKAYGYMPPYQAAESTAAVLVYVDALQRANSFDTEKVREALAATNIETFYGWVKFDETGKNIAKPMVLRQIQKGKLVPVAPSKFASGQVIYPKPRWKDR